MSVENLQLSFIEAISRYSDVNFKSSVHLPQALKRLSALLQTPQVIFSSIYTDRNNQELNIKSHCYSDDKNIESLQYFVRKFDVNNPSDLLLQIQEKSDELKVDDKSLSSCFDFITELNSQETHAHLPFYIVPFQANNQLIGLLAYQATNPVHFKGNFLASYHVIKSIFRSKYQLEESFIEKHTFQTVLDLMPQRVFWKNRDSVYMGCNKAFSQDASLADPNDIVGVTDHDIFPEQAQLYRTDDANTMKTREHLINSEEPQTHQSGNTIWLRTSKRPIINNENIVVGLVGTYDDISELKNTQEALSLAKEGLEKRVLERTEELTATNQKLNGVISELKSTQKHLVETEKMAALGGLVAGVSHEINTPLGIAVTGASHLESTSIALKEKVLSGDISKTEFISSCDSIIKSTVLILRNLERATALIRNFKMVAVDQSNDEKRSIILKKYLYEIINTMSPKTKQKSITIVVRGDDELTISTYPGTIAQIFTNLIANTVLHAFRHKENGEINIIYEVKNNEVKLSFEDNGVGIEQDKLSKIFQPFYTTNRAEGGSGLGLSIVFNLITQKLDGKITCESELNKNTRFNMSFPIK